MSTHEERLKTKIKNEGTLESSILSLVDLGTGQMSAYNCSSGTLQDLGIQQRTNLTKAPLFKDLAF